MHRYYPGGILYLEYPIADQAGGSSYVFIAEKDVLQRRASLLQGQHPGPKGSLVVDWPQALKPGVQAVVSRAVVQSRVPAVPQGLCGGAGPLLPARLSTQPARGAAQGAAGRSCGWKEPPRQGRVLLLAGGCCLGQRAHSSTAHPLCIQGDIAREEKR